MKDMSDLPDDVAGDLMEMSGKKGKKMNGMMVDLAEKPVEPMKPEKGPLYPGLHMSKIVDGLDKVGIVKTVSAKVRVRNVSKDARGGSTGLDIMSIRMEDDNGE